MLTEVLTGKIYVMVNKSTGAQIRCTHKYVSAWLGLGFEVEEIIYPESVIAK
ncbi:hypothetical protein D1872_51380 [compost metagenome]